MMIKNPIVYVGAYLVVLLAVTAVPAAMFGALRSLLDGKGKEI